MFLWFDFVSKVIGRIFGICFFDSNIFWYFDGWIKDMLVFEIMKKKKENKII